MSCRATTALFAAAVLSAAGLAPAERLDYLTADGIAFVDESGDPVVLRGVNFGNWLLLEMWMQSLFDGQIPDQHSLEALLTARFGAAEKDRLMEVWRSGFITERDFAMLADYGFNVVRLPFWHTLMEEDSAPFQLKPGAFDWMDQAIAWAEEHGVHVILDLHGAPGAQGWEHHAGQEGRNELWSSQLNQDRTAWLWRQIAARYKDRSSIAAFDLLNEPWGGTEQQLRDLIYRLSAEVREVDAHRVILLPGHFSGIGFYGDPRDQDLTNAAFTHHFYPGLFGGGDPTVATHQAYFDSTGAATSQQLRGLDAPFLVGEMNVVFDSAGGGEMMRHHFDYYAAHGWATTAWSWKVFTNGGGAQPTGWGMTTNPRTLPYVGANTWACDGWDSTFDDACEHSVTEFTAPGSGPVELHLVIKAGACCGGVMHVTMDDVSLQPVGGGEEAIVGGDFAGLDAWSFFTASGSPQIDAILTPLRPTGSSGRVLEMRGGAGDNGGIYQAMTLQGGERYRLSGRFRDAGCSPTAAWCEVYLDWREPVDGQDFPPGPQFGAINMQTASLAEIEALFASTGEMPVQVMPQYRDWLGEEDREPALLTNWPPVLRVPQHVDALPAPWRASDIGGARRGGQRVLAPNEIQIYSAGDDIWGDADSFRFAWARVEGTASITARVRSLTDTDSFAKAGVMVRGSLDADAPSVALSVRPNGSIELNLRATQGAATTSTGKGTASFPDAWLRLEADATTGAITAFKSTDGSAWVEAGQVALPPPADGVFHVGLSSTSHDPEAFAVAHFSDVALTGAPEAPSLEEQPGWQHWFSDGPVRVFAGAPTAGEQSTGNLLRLTSPRAAAGGVHRPIALQGGTTAALEGRLLATAPSSGTSRLRILLLDAPPVDGVAPAGQVLVDATLPAGGAWVDPLAGGVAFNVRAFPERPRPWRGLRRRRHRGRLRARCNARHRDSRPVRLDGALSEHTHDHSPERPRP